MKKRLFLAIALVLGGATIETPLEAGKKGAAIGGFLGGYTLAHLTQPRYHSHHDDYGRYCNRKIRRRLRRLGSQCDSGNKSACREEGRIEAEYNC